MMRHRHGSVILFALAAATFSGAVLIVQEPDIQAEKDRALRSGITDLENLMQNITEFRSFADAFARNHYDFDRVLQTLKDLRQKAIDDEHSQDLTDTLDTVISAIESLPTFVQRLAFAVEIQEHVLSSSDQELHGYKMALLNAISLTELPYRLVGGDDDTEGRVEVLYEGEWGTVCDDSWDVLDATVVCRSLGFHGPVEALQQAHYGQAASNVPILMDDVACSGEEASIFDCAHYGMGRHNCGHREDASVRCGVGPVCGDNAPGYYSGAGNCYYFSFTNMTWDAARADCLSRGMDLAAVTSQQQNDYLVSVLEARQHSHGEEKPWIGARRNEYDAFVWSSLDDHLLDSGYTNWHSGEPNDYENREDCVNYWDDHEWNDFACDGTFTFICQEMQA